MAEATPLLRDMLWLLWFCLATCWSSFLFITMLFPFFMLSWMPWDVSQTCGCVVCICMLLQAGLNVCLIFWQHVSGDLYWFLCILVVASPPLKPELPFETPSSCHQPAEAQPSPQKAASLNPKFLVKRVDQQQQLSVIKCTCVCHSSVFTHLTNNKNCL